MRFYPASNWISMWQLYSRQINRCDKMSLKVTKQSYKVSKGMRAQITEQTRETYLGGGVIPAVIPRLLTNSKYSRAPTNTAAGGHYYREYPSSSQYNNSNRESDTKSKNNPFFQLTRLLLLLWDCIFTIWQFMAFLDFLQHIHFSFSSFRQQIFTT